MADSKHSAAATSTSAAPGFRDEWDDDLSDDQTSQNSTKSQSSVENRRTFTKVDRPRRRHVPAEQQQAIPQQAARRAYDDIEPREKKSRRHRSHQRSSREKTSHTGGAAAAAPVASKVKSSNPSTETLPHETKIYTPFTNHSTLTNVQLALQSLITRLHLRLQRYILPTLSDYFYNLRRVQNDVAVFNQTLDTLKRFYGGPKTDRVELKNMGFPEIHNIILRLNPDCIQVLETRISWEIALHSPAYHTEHQGSGSLLHSSANNASTFVGPVVPQTPFFLDPYAFFDRLMMICIHEVEAWQVCATCEPDRGDWNLQVLKDILRACVDSAIDHFVPVMLTKTTGDLILEAIEIGRKHAREYASLTDYLKYRDPWLQKCVELNGQRTERKMQERETKEKETKEQQSLQLQQQQWQATQQKFQQQAEMYLGRAADTLDDIKALMEKFFTTWEASKNEETGATATAAASNVSEAAEEMKQSMMKKEATVNLMAQLMAGLNMQSLPAIPVLQPAISTASAQKQASVPISASPSVAPAATTAAPLSHAEMRKKMLELRAKINL